MKANTRYYSEKKEEEGKMGSDQVKLLYLNLSPYAMSSALALTVKGVQFHRVEEDVFNKSELLLRSNPVYKQVPVLLHNGRAVSQSLVICEYIEEAWPTPSLLPDSPYERALARFWADYINKKFMVTGLNLMKKFGEEHETARKDVVEQFLTLDKAMSAEGPFFFGDKMSLADVALAPLVPWIASFEALGELKFPDAQECGHMHRWLATMRANAHVLASLPNSSEFIEIPANLRRWIAEKYPKGL